MANVLNTDKQIMIVGALAEGSSTVSHLGPIASAAHAVRAAIIQEFRSLEPAQEI